MSQQILFKNFDLLEPSFGELRGGYQLMIEGDTVKELSETQIKAAGASVIDCGQRKLMPGLIDCHVHAIHSEVNVRFLEAMPMTLITARAATRLRAMLDRGFTTVRDTGGAAWGVQNAPPNRPTTGPSPFICRPAVLAARRHSDLRPRANRLRRCGRLTVPPLQTCH